MTTTIAVYIGGDFRTGSAWPVRQCLRPLASPHTPRDFVAVFQRLNEPIDRQFWRRYDYVEAMDLDEAENWPVVGEA